MIIFCFSLGNELAHTIVYLKVENHNLNRLTWVLNFLISNFDFRRFRVSSVTWQTSKKKMLNNFQQSSWSYTRSCCHSIWIIRFHLTSLSSLSILLQFSCWYCWRKIVTAFVFLLQFEKHFDWICFVSFCWLFMIEILRHVFFLVWVAEDRFSGFSFNIFIIKSRAYNINICLWRTDGFIAFSWLKFYISIYFVELPSNSRRSEFSFKIFIILSTVYRERSYDFS